MTSITSHTIRQGPLTVFCASGGPTTDSPVIVEPFPGELLPSCTGLGTEPFGDVSEMGDLVRRAVRKEVLFDMA